MNTDEITSLLGDLKDNEVVYTRFLKINKKIFETTFKDHDVPLTKLSENNSGYYAITDEAAAVDKLTSLKATELFKKINLKPIVPPDLRAKRTILIRQQDSSIGKLTPEEITREIKSRQPWAKILGITKMKNYTHVIKITFSEISITQKILQNGLLMFSTKNTLSQIELEKYTYIQIFYKCYKFEDHATYQCTSTTPSCSECATYQQRNSPKKMPQLQPTSPNSRSNLPV
ncbi:hypothetical protein FHG87_021807 [Trinorchestia longiramus]|nr:hypothetical protein FHG87_021807 [Trinorchestia longiramus]